MSAISIENGKRVGELLEITKAANSAYFLVDVNDLSRKISITSLRNAFSGDSATSNKANLYYTCEKIDEYLETVNDNILRIQNDMDNMTTRMDDVYNNFGDNLTTLQALVEQYHTELVTKDEEITLQFNNEISSLNTKLNQEITDRTTAITNTKNELNTTISNLDDKLTKYINTEISDEAKARSDKDTELSNTITSEASRLDGRIDELSESTTESINTINTSINTLDTKISDLSTTVTNNLNDANSKFTAINNILNTVTKFSIGTSVPSTLSDNEVYFQYFT